MALKVPSVLASTANPRISSDHIRLKILSIEMEILP